MLLNCNQRGERSGGNNRYLLEYELRECAKQKGGYVIGLLACNRRQMPEAATRGGTDAIVRRPIEDSGQVIMIHAIENGDRIFPE